MMRQRRQESVISVVYMGSINWLDGKWPALSHMLEGRTSGPKILMPELQNIKKQTGTYNIIGTHTHKGDST